jgi:diacylglycerol kinase family enzyme
VTGRLVGSHRDGRKGRLGLDAWLDATTVDDRLELPSVRILEEDADRDLVIAFLPGDSFLVKAALERCLLLGRDPDAGVLARPAEPVEREARVAEVRHHRVAFALDDPGAQDAFVERGSHFGVVRLDRHVVNSWHGPGTMPSPLLIVNPSASAVTDERAAAVAEILGVEPVATEGAGHATELAAESESDSIVVFGGDGAFNEVLNGLRSAVSVGFVPGGGSSVLPRALGLPREPEAAARQIAEALQNNRRRRISVGRVNGRRFGFAAAVGFPAEVVRRVDELGRANGRRQPDRAFALTVARALIARGGRFEPELEIDGEPAAFALIANGDPYTYLARLPLRFAPDARFESGLDLVAPRRVRFREIPRLTVAGALGRKVPGVVYRHDLDRLEIRCAKPQPLQVDGEDLGDVEQAIFGVERGALTVLA